MAGNDQAFLKARGDESGMELRDYFTGQALAGLCTKLVVQKGMEQQIANLAYEVADEMISIEKRGSEV